MGGGGCSETGRTGALYVEAGKVLRLSAPLATTNISIVSLAFLGRLGGFELSVATLSVSLFNVTGMSVLQGFNSSLEAFCG